MYISVRDVQLPGVFGNTKAGLDAMSINAVELEYAKDRSVHSLDAPDGARVSLATEHDLESFAYKCAGLACRVSALLLSNDFGATDLNAEIDYVISAIKAADKLGAKAIRIDAIMSTESQWPLDKRTQHVADCMTKVLDATKNIGVAMGIENHGTKGNEQDFLDTVLNQVNSPRLGLTLDTANFYWYGHPLHSVHEIIKHFAPKVKHTHIKNIDYPEDKRESQRDIGWEYGKYCSSLREGNIDIHFVVENLKAAGYKGDLCIENEALGRYNLVQQRAMLKDDADYLREILAKV